MATRRDLVPLLRTLSIPFTEITEKAVNVNCPFCTGRTSGRRDSKERCGIFYSTLRFHCFRCKRVGPLFTLLKMMVGLTWTQYESYLGRTETADEDLPLAARVRERLRGSGESLQTAVHPEIDLPGLPVDEDVWEVYPEIRRFIRDRDFTQDHCRLYETHYPGRNGKHGHRLIIPVHDYQGKVVAFQGRDTTGRKKAKYLSEGPVGEFLYWSPVIERREPIYVVEGAFDVWRMEWNAVGSFTHALTLAQRRQLVTDPLIDEVVICWDSDSWDKSLSAAYSLAPIMGRVGVARLPEGEDPDSLGGDVIRELPIRWI